MVYTLNKKDNIKILENLLLFRITEQLIAKNYQKNKMRCPVHLSIGQEAISAAFAHIVDKEDYAMSSHRSHLHYLAKGGNLKSMILEIHGKQGGCSNGKGGSMHLIDKSKNFMGSTAIVSNSIPVATGLALSIKLRKKKNISYSFFGDGAVEEGAFYESVNFAVVKNLPILYVCENNFYSVYTSLSQRQPKNRKIYKMVEGLGIKTFYERSNDVTLCIQSFRRAVDYIKKKKKPAFIQFDTFRYLEHCGPNYDDNLNYRDKGELSKWIKKDPVKAFKSQILSKKILNINDIKKMENKIYNQIFKIINNAERSPFPSIKDLKKDIYA